MSVSPLNDAYRSLLYLLRLCILNGRYDAEGSAPDLCIGVGVNVVDLPGPEYAQIQTKTSGACLTSTQDRINGPSRTFPERKQGHNS